MKKASFKKLACQIKDLVKINGKFASFAAKIGICFVSCKSFACACIKVIFLFSAFLLS